MHICIMQTHLVNNVRNYLKVGLSQSNMQNPLKPIQNGSIALIIKFIIKSQSLQHL